MKVLTPSEVVMAAKLATGISGVRAGESAAKLAVVEVDGEAVTYEQLAGGKWKTLFPRTREKMQLIKAWNRIHSPDQVQIKAVLANMAVTVTDGAELWTVTLPSGKVAILEEPDLDTIADVLDRVQTQSKNPVAQQLLLSRDAVRRSLVSVDGQPVDRGNLAKDESWDALFGVVDTMLLGAAWEEAFDAGGDEAVLGEARPVSGT